MSALKIDMIKAYDLIEWQYLHDMMVQLGFHSRWVELIMRCISTVRYNIIHNVEDLGQIIPKRD